MAEEEKLSLKKANQFGINGYIPAVQLCNGNENATLSYYGCCLDNMQIKHMWLVSHKKSRMTNGADCQTRAIRKAIDSILPLN